MSDKWETIDSAPRDGRYIDSYNAYNGERRVSRWYDNGIYFEPYWLGWWQTDRGNVPTHWKPLPQPETRKEIS